MARRSLEFGNRETLEGSPIHFYPGQGKVPPGTYREVETGRLVHLEQEDDLPASMNGRVACYRKLSEPEARAAAYRENRKDTALVDPWGAYPLTNAPQSLEITARDIMTSPVITVRDTMTLREVAELFASKGISGAPVTDNAEHLVGIVSEKDLLSHAHSQVNLSRVLSGATALYSGLGVAPKEFFQEAYAAGIAARASEVMSYPVVTAKEEDTPAHLADLMLTHRLNRIPILRDGKPVGIVTREDVLRAITLMANALISEITQREDRNTEEQLSDNCLETASLK